MRALFLLHLPPPVHGSSVVGKEIFESVKLKDLFEIQFIDLLASKSVDNSGKFNWYKLFQFLSSFKRIVTSLLFHRPKFCYYALSTSGFAFYRDAIFITLIKSFRIPIIFHLHNKGIKRNSTNWFNILLNKWVFYEEDVILLSSLLYFDIDKYVTKDRVYICPNGVSPILGIRRIAANPSLIFVSNLFKSKGVIDLIFACSILNAKGLRFTLKIVGNEGDLNFDEIRKLIVENRLSEIVEICGPVYGYNKEQLLLESSIFVFPTYYEHETFGLVNLEAMQAQLPIISTFEGGIPDIVEDGVTGFLVPQRDIVALADRMEQLILNPELCQQMGSAGRKRYEELFTAEIFENRITEILQEVSLKFT